MKNVAMYNLGCKVNAYELDAIGQMLLERGYNIVPFAPNADIYIINTCTVTNIADRKSRQIIRRARRFNPNGIVIAMGCYVQSDEVASLDSEDIDIAIGNNRKNELPNILDEYYKDIELENIHDGGYVFLADDSDELEYEELSIDSPSDHTRAFVKIQDGCNRFCSYCIIPYVRGRVRSRNIEDIRREVIRLGNNGYKEIVLTGIHLSSYGDDFKDIHGDSLGLIDVIENLAKIESIVRIRLGSLEPSIIDMEFVDRISRIDKMCHHYHLSLQSGCDSTLTRMNRRYTTKMYMDSVKLIRSKQPNAMITTDIIVGFPGESEEEFEVTKLYVKSIDYYETHIFKYSNRKGTKASKMSGQVSDRIKTRRSKELIHISDEGRKCWLYKHIGAEAIVLVEELIEIGGVSYFMGYTKNYIRAGILSEGSNINVGDIIDVRGIDILSDDSLLCELIST